MAAADQESADLIAFVDTLDPAEALTNIVHVARYIEKIAESDLIEQDRNLFVGLVGLSSAVIQGLHQQIADKPGGLMSAEVSPEESVVHQINRGVQATLRGRQA